MADNWKNNILPGPNDFDLGSLAYDENDSLEAIAGKYQNLGSQVNNLAKAAAEDVHTRQVKLIGNDFGGVNPMMYATYYQPSANDTQSAMRMAGTEKALNEGMERGKAAAEADLNNAKNEYDNALDGYNNAKEAFANLTVAMVPSDMLPDNTTQAEMFSQSLISGNREKTRQSGMQAYTDAQGVDWSNEDLWSKAAQQTISDRGVDTSNWSQEDWDSFWKDPTTSYTFNNNYVSNYIRQNFGEEKYQAYVNSYNTVLNRVDQIFDYVNELTDSLPELKSPDLFYLGENKTELSSGDSAQQFLDTILSGGQSEEDKYTYSYAYYTEDKWVEEHIAEEYRDDVKKYIETMKNLDPSTEGSKAKRVQEILSENPTMSVPEANSKAVAEFGKAYVGYISDKIKSGDELGKANTTDKSTDELVKELLGFDISDAMWIRTWKQQNPDEYESMKNQIAQLYGQSNALEIADGERWYYTAKGYEQLPSGTPVFFAYDGALNADGSIRDDDLKEFVEQWNNFYKADSQGLSEEELTTAQEAMTEAYKKYMQHVSAGITVNNVFNVPVTPAIYNAILSNFDDPATSDAVLWDDYTAADLVKEFKADIAKDKDAATRWFYSLANNAYTNSKTFMRYSNALDSIVNEKKTYDKDSDARGAEKLKWYEGAYTNPKINGTPEDAVAAYLVLTRSMEKFNTGSQEQKELNIDPSFLAEDFIGKATKSVGKQAMGLVDFWSGLTNLVVGTVAFPFTGKAPAEFGDYASFNNTIASIFTGEKDYAYGENSPVGWWQTAELQMQLDDKAREYALTLVNPLLIDVYYGGKDISTVKGIGGQYSVEGKGMFEDAAALQNTAINIGAMVLTNVAEGAVLGKGIELTAKAADRLKLYTLPASTSLKATNIANDTVGHGATIFADINDPYALAQATSHTLELTSAIDDAGSLANTVDDLSVLSVVDDAGQDANLLSRYTNLANIADGMPAVEQNFGIFNRRAANAFSSMSYDNIDDLYSMYSGFAKQVSNTIDDIAEMYTQGASAASLTEKVVLRSGQSMSIAEASAVVAANRTISTYALSGATGISSIDIARIPDGVRNMLMKTLNGITSSGPVVANKSLGKFLRTLSADDFTNLVQAFADRAAVNAAMGKSWDAFDMYRALGAAGWEKSSARALAREFLTDALTDPLRDLRRNAMLPQIDENGNAKVETISEYFSNPENLLLNLGISSLHFGIQRAWNQFGMWHWSKESKKAWDAFNNTKDKTSATGLKALERAENATLKAQQYADKAWRKGMSYNKVLENATMSNDVADKALKDLFKTQGWDLEYGGTTREFKTADDFIKFMTDDAAPPKELLMSLENTILVKAANIYNLTRVQMGTDINEFGNLPRTAYIKIWDTMRNTVNANLDDFTGNGKPIMDNIHGMYQTMKADLLAANDAGEFGMKVRNFEKSLDSFFNNLETMAKDGLDSGFLPNVRVGYLPIGSLYFDGSFDDMIKAHVNGATRGFAEAGGIMDKAAPDPSAPRDVISLDSLIDAMKKGDEVLELKNDKGEVFRTVRLDYDGLNPIDNMTYYMNNYTMHKYIDPLMGDKFMDYGSASMRNGRAFVVGSQEVMTNAWTREMKAAGDQLFGYDGTTKDGKEFHHTGHSEIIAKRALEQGIVNKAQAADIAKQGYTNLVISEKQQAELDVLQKQMSDAMKRSANAKKIIDAGDSYAGQYSIMSSVFATENGTPVDGKWVVENGTKVAKILTDAYSKGEISEDSIRTGYTIKANVNGKVAYRDIPVTENLLTMLDNAAKNSGQINSDLIAYGAIYNDISTPYWSKKVENGVTTTVPVEGYKSLLMEKYNIPAQKLELDETPTASAPKATESIATLQSGNITVATVKANPDKVFLFGDNIEDAKTGYVPKSTQAVIRGQENAIGIPTKKNRGTIESSYFTDADFDEFKQGVDTAISAAKETGKQIVIPKAGIGTGKAQLKKRAPKCFEYLNNELNKLQATKYTAPDTLTVDVKGYDKYGMVDINKTNKFIADAIFKNDGNVVFGATKVVDELTGKVTYEGGKEFQADKLYGSRYALTRSETDDIVVKTSESKFADLQDATELQLYSALGAKVKNGEFAPTEYQKRVVESIITRTKTEVSDMFKGGTFNGSEWFNAVDARTGDVNLMAKFGEGWNTSRGGYNNAAAVIKGLEKDGSLELFKDNLEKVATRALAGEYDALLPNGMTRQQLADMAVSARALMDAADDYKYRPKKAEEIATRVDDETGEEMSADNLMPKTDINGKVEEELPISGREVDLEKDVVESQMDKLIDTLKAYYDEGDPLHKVFASEDLTNLHEARVSAKTKTSAIAEKLNTAAKELYDSGKSSEFNKLVDSAYQDVLSRMKDKTAGKDAAKFYYLEALEVAPPESGLSSIGSGSYGQTNAQYNAAMLEQATGVADTSVSGWSEKITQARLEAGTYGGYAQQLANGVRTLRQFAGSTDAYADILDEAETLFAQLDSTLKTSRPDSMDNFENSLIAVMADVYDPANRTVIRSKAQLTKLVKDADWRLDNIAGLALEGKIIHNEGMTVTKLSKASKALGDTNEAMRADYEKFLSASKIVNETEFGVQYGLKTGTLDVPESINEALRNYNATVDELYAKYGVRGQSRGQFENRLSQYAGQYDDTYKYYQEYKGASTESRFVSDSAAKGKVSAFTPAQLKMPSVSNANLTVGEDISFNIETKNGMRNVTIEQDYGTAQELSNTAVGIRFRNDSGTIAELDNLKGAGKDKFYEAAAKALDENNSNLAIIKQVAGEKGPSSIENPNYDWTKGGKQYDADGKEITPYIDQGKTSQRFSDDVLQDFGDGWVLVARNVDPYARIVERSFRGKKTELSPMDVAEMAMLDYADKTQDYIPEKAMQKAHDDYDKAEKEVERTNKKISKIKDSIDTKNVTMASLAKKVLSEEEYADYRKAADTYNKTKAAKPTEGTDIYRPADGSYTIIKKGRATPTGYTTVADLLKIVGFDPEHFNSDISDDRVYTEAEIKASRKARKEMMKDINENMRAGNVRYKNVKPFDTPSTLDLKSQTMTINNLRAFAKQARGAVNLDEDIAGSNIKYGDVIVDKDTADLIYRYSRENIGTKNAKDWIKTVSFELTDWNKFIQNLQLAGGASWVNALSIAQLRGQILSNPFKMAEYIKLCTDFKNDDAVRAFMIANQAKLSEIAVKANDYTITQDLMSACSENPGADGGIISAQAESVDRYWKNRKATERTGSEKYEYAKDAIQNSTEALFGDATFKRMLPVLRAKTLMLNYDKALRVIQKKFKNISLEDANDAAIKFSYAKTTAFFEPGKTSSGFKGSKSISDVLQDINNERLRDTVANWTGAKDEVSIGQMASNCFFAMGYKYRMIAPLWQGFKSWFSIGDNIERVGLRGTFDATDDMSIQGNATMNALGTQFMQSGNRAMVASLAGIATIAFINAKALGLSTSWDDLDFIYTDEDGNPLLDADGNPMYKIPDILTKFQTIGQIWIPNAIGENGIPYVDPTKRAFKLDTMSSMFTLPNTFWKTIDRTINSRAYYSAPQRGIGLIGQSVINPQGINDFLNQPFLRAIGDEAIGSNLLSPYKAMYEVLVDSSYYGNNIWEKKWLKDGSINPNYDPLRNVQASFLHILGLDELLDPNGYNRWVKGYYTDDYKAQDQVGTISGSGILQHEYFTMIQKILGGEAIEGVIEGGELPIKSQKLSSSARTEFNTKVKNIIAEYMAEYRNKTDGKTDVSLKDEAYAEAVKKSADVVAAWSAKYKYVLGKDQSLVPYVTRCMMAILAGEYDDRLAYIQNAYWKASDIAQIEASGPADYWLADEDVEEWIKQGKTAEDFAKEKNKRTDAYHQALDDEYRARKALHDAGIDNEWLAGQTKGNLESERRQINKEVYYGALQKLNSKIGEFDNFKEMKEYYESQIDAATTTKQKAKLANQYNKYVTDALAPYVEKYGASIISDGYYNHDYLSNALAEYIIIPADKHYTGKTPRSSYLKDLFGVGYRDTSNLPSDDEVIAAYTQARTQMQSGAAASAVAILDRLIDAIKRGRLYASDIDYSKIVKVRALLSARSH